METPWKHMGNFWETVSINSGLSAEDLRAGAGQSGRTVAPSSTRTSGPALGNLAVLLLRVVRATEPSLRLRVRG
jgi:hypothetical protein